MTMHRIDVSARFGVPANGRPSPSPTIGGARSTAAAVCEWTVDLDGDVAAPFDDQPAASGASRGYVDFDAIETVHLASSATVRR